MKLPTLKNDPIPPWQAIAIGIFFGLASIWVLATADSVWQVIPTVALLGWSVFAVRYGIAERRRRSA